MNHPKLLDIAPSIIFRKASLDLIKTIIESTAILDTMNRYTRERYGDDFWLGGINFNLDYKLVCPPTSFGIDFSMSSPFGWINGRTY
jgi:hypothetical protein